jgi:phosphate starvation-inducible membrane PsiE
MGCSDQCRYSVVAGGEVIARLTCRVMLFLFFVRLGHWLYHCYDMPFRWNISSVVVTSLVRLVLTLRDSIVSLLICRRAICVSFISLPFCFGLLT